MNEPEDFIVFQVGLEPLEEDGVVDGVEVVVDVEAQHPVGLLHLAEAVGAVDGADGAFLCAVAVAVVDKEAVELGRDEGEDGLLDDFVLDGEESQFAFFGVFLGYLDAQVGLGSPGALSQFGDDVGEMSADVHVVLLHGDTVKPSGGVLALDELPRRQQGLILTEPLKKATCRHGYLRVRQVVRTRHWSWPRCRWFLVSL